MRTNFLFIICLLFAGSYSHAQLNRCLKSISYSDQCPTLKTASGFTYPERFKSASGVCGNGSTKSVSVSYCSSKSMLASKLSYTCILARQCGLVLSPTPLPIPIAPVPISYPPKLPPILPPEEPVPISYPPKLPPEEPIPIPPPFTDIPSPSLPPPVVIQPPTSAPVTTSFKGQLSSMSTALNIVSVKWSQSALISNYCGTGIQYIHYAKLDKSVPENAAFFLKYTAAMMQSMSVTLVCRAPRQQSSALVEARLGDAINTTTYIYPDGCYISSFTELAKPPLCMLP